MVDIEVQQGSENTLVDRLHKNSDLFGGESDSDSDTPPHTVQAAPARPPSSPTEVAPKKKARGKKEPREKKPKKLKKSEVQQIHSDSQRMVRESSLNLPKYQPKTKDLMSFLTRVRSRKPQSTPVVTVIKSTPLDLVNDQLVNKENATKEDSLLSEVVTTPTTEDHTPSPLEVQSDNEAPATTIEACVDEVQIENTDLEEKENNSEAEDTLTPPPALRKASVEEDDADLSFSVSPTTPTHHSLSSNRDSTALKVSRNKELTKTVANKTKIPVYTKQSTLTSLFVPRPQPVTVTEALPLPPPPSLPQTKPQLSSMDDFLFERDEALTVDVKPQRELTPLEKFQLRFSQHATSSQSRLETKASSKDEEDTSLPKEVANKPGAVRQHLRHKLQQQLSQLRAEERQAAEEVKKMYCEDPEEEEEMEEEVTDGETTDEEYELDKEAAGQESDACSDLDEEEKVGESKDNTDGSPEPSNQSSDEEEGNSDSDEDDVNIPTLVKKKSTGLRILDSDEEGDGDLTTSSPSKQPLKQSAESTIAHVLNDNTDSTNSRTKRSIPELNQDYSMSMFDSATSDGTNLSVGLTRKDSYQRRSSLLLDSVEPSMPPLLLSPDSEGPESPFGSQPCLGNEVRSFNAIGSGSTFDVTKDSGVGTLETIAEDDDSQNTLGLDESACGSVSESVGAGGAENSEKDSSLEMSFQWPGPSLPPGQPRRENSDEKVFGATFDPQSQWEDAQALPPISMAAGTQDPHNSTMEEATQFLDADGFLCLSKKTIRTHSSAIPDSLDHTQPSSPSELLNLCFGKFENTQVPPALSRHRHSSDSSSTQGVREFLGLSAKPKASGISELLSNKDGLGHSGSSQNFSQLNEVIGLCSGVFPTTQTQITRPSQFRGSVCGTSDGQSSDESVEESQDVRTGREDWANNERGLGAGPGGGYNGDSESEDEDMPRIKKKKVKVNKSDRLAQFVESEAELSGSDVGPDDDIDDEILAEEEAGLFGYEEDKGHDSDVPDSENELWDQVNKAHMKHTLADDKADLQDFKERFLKDGDLFEDGLTLRNGFFRTRRFAKQGSEAGSLDLFSEGVGECEVEGVAGEGEELSSQAEARRRKERLEREEFMMKCRQKDNSLLAMDEDSQSILSIIVDNSSQSTTTTPLTVRSKQVPKLTTPSLSSGGGYRHTRGSFLKHDSTTLRRLSSLTSVTPKTSAVGSGFVFQKKSNFISAEDETVNSSTKPKKRLITSKSSEAKKPKLDKSLSAPPGTPSSSIFSMLK